MSHKGQHSHNFKQIEAYSLFAQTADKNNTEESHHKKKSHKHKHHKKRRSSTGDLAAEVPAQTITKGNKDLAQSIPGQVLSWKRKQKKKYVYGSESSDDERSHEKSTN
eukprot:TRINITY_DN5412_c0_g1_i1.p2 TRINITY_DN5412_c0_g1~~TRINITY_DN5412_c0_g1_i1.p2  ORF type:complete len:108 (-),score=22.20 TRINITY_DN5412_c0_g1_i1:77-400(-)